MESMIIYKKWLIFLQSWDYKFFEKHVDIEYHIFWFFSTIDWKIIKAKAKKYATKTQRFDASTSSKYSPRSGRGGNSGGEAAGSCLNRRCHCGTMKARHDTLATAAAGAAKSEVGGDSGRGEARRSSSTRSIVQPLDLLPLPFQESRCQVFLDLIIASERLKAGNERTNCYRYRRSDRPLKRVFYILWHIEDSVMPYHGFWR